MSIRIMHLVWNITLPAPKKLVLLALADNANDEGDCYPSITTLTRKCSLSERAVQYAISQLVEEGHVSRDIRSGRLHPRTTCNRCIWCRVHGVHPPPEQNGSTLPIWSNALDDSRRQTSTAVEFSERIRSSTWIRLTEESENIQSVQPAPIEPPEDSVSSQ